MPVDIDRAVAFTRAHGDELDQAQLSTWLMDSEPPARELQLRLLAGQRENGGWPPFWAPDYSSVDATCFKLAQGEALAIGYADPAFARAVGFLRARQRADGSWEEDETVSEQAPPWATPGEPAPRLYMTANCGWLLTLATLTGGNVTRDEAAHRAGAYLEQHQAPDGSLPSFLQAQWLAAALWTRVGRDDLARRVLDHLVTQLDEETPSGALAWLLTTLAGVIEDDHPLIRVATALLMARQRADGGWTSEDGAARDAYVTVEALRSLSRWGAI